MSKRLHMAKNLLTSLSVHQHSPDAFKAIKKKPGGINDVIAKNYNLPLAMLYVDDDKKELVIGLSKSTESDCDIHTKQLKNILGDLPFNLKYVNIIRDSAPGKKQDCRPLWGGVRMNGDATLSVVYNNRNGEPVTILSSHAIGHNGQTGQSVGQAAKISTYGKVTVNPSLALRASDSALASITNARIQGQANRIWFAPDEAYIVNDYAISANTPEGLVIYMQGAQEDALQRGTLLRKGVSVMDGRGTLTGQILSNYVAQGGDSGAPIFYLTEVAGYVIYIGIHAGRVLWDDNNYYPYYSPWESIRDELGLTQYEADI